MSEKPKELSFFIQDPFTEDVQGPLSVAELKQWFAKGAVEGWGVSKSPKGPWTPASEVKGLAPPRAPSGVGDVAAPAALKAAANAGNGAGGGKAVPLPPLAAQANRPATESLKQSTAEPAASTALANRISPAGRIATSLANIRELGVPRNWKDAKGWLQNNSRLSMIVSGCWCFALGMFLQNDVLGGIGAWTVIAGLALPFVRKKFPDLFANLYAKSSPMSAGAIAGLALGALIFLSSMAADTTVSTDAFGGGRVHNIGLMNRQRNGMTLGGLLMAAGLVLGGLHLYQKRESLQAQGEVDNKICPKCGESIKRVAVVCKHCKSDLS